MEPEFFAVFHAGIHEELGELIVALDGLNDAELDRVLNAAQMVDSEAQDLYERRAEARRIEGFEAPSGLWRCRCPRFWKIATSPCIRCSDCGAEREVLNRGGGSWK